MPLKISKSSSSPGRLINWLSRLVLDWLVGYLMGCWRQPGRHSRLKAARLFAWLFPWRQTHKIQTRNIWEGVHVHELEGGLH